MQQNAAAFSNGLTPRQALALPHLACSISATEGANRAQINRSTLRRWMNDAHFRSALQHMRDEAASLAKTKLQALTLKSVIVLNDSLDGADEALRLRAARTVLSAAQRAEDSREVQRRIEVLDDALSLLKHQL